MLDVRTLRGHLTTATTSARVVVRCLNGGRDLQDSSQRAIILLVDTLDSLYRLRIQLCCGDESDIEIGESSESNGVGVGTGGWLTDPGRMVALAETLECFCSTMKSMELYFQPGGVGVTFYRKKLLEQTFFGRLKRFKVLLLLFMQPVSNRSFLDKEIFSLKLLGEVESGPKLDTEFEERVLGISSQLASEHFITLADLCNRRLQGTGQWLFEDEEYERWLMGFSKTLYCVGPPGVGKTFLSASIIDSLQRTFTSPDVATVFIFCQDETQRELTTLDLLRNILAQLVYRRRSLSYASSALYHSESVTKGKASPKVYQNAIRAEVDRFSKVFFIIDGLDMMSDKERFLTRLQKLPDQVQLLVTLREVTQIGDEAYVSVMAPSNDLQAYAVSRIESDPNLSVLLKQESSPRLYDMVVNVVTERSHGIFLLAKIHLESLSRYAHKSRKGLFENVLRYLPHTLNEAYGEAMKQVVGHSKKATSYVYWTLYSLRPLSVGELKCATNSADGEADDEEAISFEHSLQTQSAGILTVDAITGSVCFVHRTAKEYLSGAPARVFFPAAQKDIAETCLTAITPDEVVDDCYYNGGTPSRSSGNGFLNYAAMYWGSHAREVSEDEQTIQVLIKTFLNKLLWRRPPLQVLTNEPRMPSELGLGRYPQDWTALHILAYFGIVSKSRRLHVQGANLDANDNSFRITPLHCAASQGNLEVAEFLLDNGADANTTARDGSTALHLATQYGHRQIMKLFLHHPVNPQVANDEGATALQLAIKTEWDEGTVPLLVKNKVDVNTRNLHTGDTALHVAIKWRRPRIVLHLLEKGASIDMTNEDGLTPLQLAVKVDNCEAISVLLQRRANIEARSLSGSTALQVAASEGHWIAFDLLMLGGADINAWNREGEPLIHKQARLASSPAIASKLLAHGADIDTLNSKGMNALHCAAAAGNKTMFIFLLEHGAKPETLTSAAESILHLTPPTTQDGLDILKLATLNFGLDVNAPSSKGWTPLHQAVYVGTGASNHDYSQISEYIHFLLSANANVNARLQPPSRSQTNTPSSMNMPMPMKIAINPNTNAETPLHLAVTAIVPRPSLLTLLIASGADVNAATAEGKTPLHLAAERGRESLFRILYEAGADISAEAPDSARADDGQAVRNGTTPLEVALKNPFGREWFSHDGELKPWVRSRSGNGRRRKSAGISGEWSAGGTRRDSVGTVIEEDLGGDTDSGTDGHGDADIIDDGDSHSDSGSVSVGHSVDEVSETEGDGDELLNSTAYRYSKVAKEFPETLNLKDDDEKIRIEHVPVSLRNETPYVIV